MLLLQTSVLVILISEVRTFLEVTPPGGVGSFFQDDKLQFTTTLPVFDPEIDTPLKVTCKFVPSDHPDVIRLLTLTLTKRGVYDTDDIKLITISESGIKDADDFFGIGTGEIHNGGPDSFVQAEITHPTDQDVGEYKCQSRVLDKNGEPVKSEKALVVTDLLGCVKGKQRQSLSVLKQSLLQCGVSEANWFQELRDLAEVNAAKDKTIYGVTEVFNATSFYVITINDIKFQKGLEICKEHNGYLAEVNTEEEFLFLNDSAAILRTDRVQEFYNLVTGATFEYPGKEFRFETHPEAPVYLGHWAEGEPHYLKSSNRLHLYDKNHEGRLLMADGFHNKNSWNSYLCEVSKDIE